jgi:DNA-binding MarR family transcriptional regulator
MSRRSQDLPRSRTEVLLPAAARAVVGLYRPYLAPLDLTHPQFLVLLVLELGQPRAVAEIGQLLALTPSTMTPILKRLEALRHIRRSRDEADERRLAVTLTPSGLAMIPDLQGLRDRVNGIIALSPAERQLLQEHVADMTRAADEAG